MAEGAARLVHGLKYEGWRAVAGTMGQALEPAARRLAGRERPVLVPVPLTAARRRERGFNQAQLLARALGEATGWPVAEWLARRSGAGRQVGLGRAGRRRAMRHRFVLRDAAPAAQPIPLLLIVDDVVTTGATAAACLEAISEGGLRCGGVVSFARAVRPISGD
ncbi:MAG: ComF family protein [Gemmatimonadota bacterium]